MGQADRVLALALAGATALALFVVATFEHGRDQGIYTVVARTLLDGGMPYRDAFDFKPPGIYLIYAVARLLFGSWQHGIRLIEVAGMAATVVGLAHLADRFWGDPLIGWWAGAAATLVHAQVDFWHSAQPETFGGMLTVMALLVGTQKSQRVQHHLVCGLLFGMAGLLKPPLAGGGVVLAFWAARKHPRFWPPIAAVFVGGATVFAATAVWFAARGALDAMLHTLFVFTPHYTALGWQDRSLWGLCLEAVVQWLTFSSFMSVGLALGAWYGRKHSHVALLLGIVFVQLLGVALQGKFFLYHFGGVWPVTGLLAALGFVQLWSRAKARGVWAVAGFVVLAVVACVFKPANNDLSQSFWRRTAERVRVFVFSPHDRPGKDALATVADVSAAANREVAARLVHLPAGAGIFIWGFEPVIYDLSQRRAVSRYIYNVPQRVAWSAESSRVELMDRLRADPPAAIVVAHHDAIPMVTGDGRDSAALLEAEFRALKRFVGDRYGEPERVEDFEIYALKADSAD